MPNNSFDSNLQFGGVAQGESGPAQSINVLNTFSNYADLEHGNGNIVEVNIFKEMSIGAADLGKTYRFTFDYKAGDLALPARRVCLSRSSKPVLFS